jgi:4-amino-4-deoxy-L-arabinose transferase-like glycosyltransferase
MSRGFRRRLAGIAALGFGLRAVVALAVAPASLTARGDPRYFHQAANLLADGHGYIIPAQWFMSGAEVPATEHPPLWSAVLSPFAALGATSVHSQQLVGCAVGAATIACAGALGRRVGGDRVGLLAAAACALYPVFVAMDGSLMSEPLYALCVAVVLLTALRVAEAPSLRRSALLGLVIGVTALARTEAIALVVLIGVPLALRLRERRATHLAVVTAVALAAVAPWCIRNSVELHRPMLVSSEDGSVLAGANCPLTYRGYDMGYWNAHCVRPAHDRNSAFASVRLRAVGLRYARDHAGRIPAVEGVRLLRTFGIWQAHRHVYFAEGRDLPWRSVAVGACWAVLALGLAGAVVLRRADPWRLGLLLTPVALAVITTLLAFGYPRFRYAADVSLLVLAALVVERVWRRYGRRPAKRSEPAAAPSSSTSPPTANAEVASRRTFFWPRREPRVL